MSTDTPQAWYKQGWPWFLIAIPLATVIAGIITLVIASREPSSLVVDDYFKKGLAINQSLERENHAKQLGIHGKLELKPQQGQVRVVLKDISKIADLKNTRLVLTFYHPTRKASDQRIALEWLGGMEFAGPLKALKANHWYFALEDEKKSWLVKGSLIPSDTAVADF